MKKTLLAMTLLAGLSTMNANATVINFNDSTFGGSGVTFDSIDWTPDTAKVVQTDTGNGTIFGGQADLFQETGSTFLVNFLNSNAPQTGVLPYATFLDYAFGGTVSAVTLGSTAYLNVAFNSGTALLKAVYNSVETVLGTFNLEGGDCLISTKSTTGSCLIGMSFTATPGYFSYQGIDLATFGPVNSKSDLIVTVQNIKGLNPSYSAPGASQEFTINHDGNQTFTVSEPTTLGVLGLGLLALGVSRRKQAA